LEGDSQLKKIFSKNRGEKNDEGIENRETDGNR